MYAFWVMLKTNIKLILRKKQTLFLLVLIPILSTLILNITDTDANQDPAREFKMGVVIVDDSKTELSKKMVEVLEKNPSLRIEVLEEADLSKQSAEAFFIEKANQSENTSFLYIPQEFESQIVSGNLEIGLLFFETGADGRAEQLEVHINKILEQYGLFSYIAKGNKEVLGELIKKTDNMKIEQKKVIISKTGDIISNNQTAYSFSLEMFVAALTVILIFANNAIIDLFFKERHNQVLKRIRLSCVNMLSYTSIKIILAIISLSIQTALIMLGIKLMVDADLGMSVTHIGFLIFGLGLVVTSVSICSAVFLDSITTANYLGLGLITITNMLAGLYFPLESTPLWMQNASMFFPQRWFVFAANQYLQGNRAVLGQYALVISAMMFFFLAISLLGLRMNKIND